MKIHNAEVSRAIALPALIALLIPLASCSRIQLKRSPIVFRIDEKAVVGPVVYTILNVGRQTSVVRGKLESLDKDSVLVLIRATNTSPNEARMVPVMTLVDDDGQIYGEVAPANGSPDWLGNRKLGPAQTKQGTVAFRAPVRHYRLSMNAQVRGKDVLIDVPAGAIAEGFSTASGTPALTVDNNSQPMVPLGDRTSLRNADPLHGSSSLDYANTLDPNASLTNAEARTIH